MKPTASAHSKKKEESNPKRGKIDSKYDQNEITKCANSILVLTANDS